MKFSEILGNEPIKAYLERGIKTNSLHHTLLFCGPEGVGKVLFARALAHELLGRSGDHPDLHLYYPEGKSGTHSIESLRGLIEEVRKPPFEAKRKVFIIERAERMQPAAANALLKTLEEPELDCVIILITHRPQELLPTLVSRCAQLNFEQTPNLAERGRAEQLFLDSLEKKIPFFHAVEEIEACWSSLEGFELQKAAQELFVVYLSWARTQELQGKASLDKALLKVSEAKTALERNIKPSACLQYLHSQTI